MKHSKQEVADAKARLLEWVKPGDTVYTILRHVSRSGMQREIGLVLIDKDGDTKHPNHAAATVLGWPLNKNGDGLKVGGCGMDMGFHLVYELSAALFPRKAGGDVDGGYALKQRWL